MESVNEKYTSPARGKKERHALGEEGVLPVVIASSVVRSTQKGESHGGVYLINMNNGVHEQVIDWNDPTISWEGRGADRGLRGIAFWKDRIYLAASNEIFVFDQSFQIIDSLTSPYLNHCHEIDIYGDYLYLTSTGFDSVLEVDLNEHQFTRGITLRMSSSRHFGSHILRRLKATSTRISPHLSTFDPEKSGGAEPGDQLHINSVVADSRGLFVSGRRLGCLLHISIADPGHERLIKRWPTPFGTHNVIPISGKETAGCALMNDTNRDEVVVVDEHGCGVTACSLPKYRERDLEYNDIPEDHARQGFGRGLCEWKEGIVIVGSSPATVSAYELSSAERIASVNLTMDVRNAVHGLEVWSF
jgi:hypothetical protein